MTERLIGFADPWEHLRLLADAPRNRAYEALLARRAPGATVVEIGCGTGVLACVAARLGASQVIAVEETGLAEVAQALASANGLDDRVHVVQADFLDLSPQPADLVYSELLNAEPFAEDILAVSRAAAAWVGDHGHLAPQRLEVWVALVRDTTSAEEAALAQRELARLGEAHRLELGPVRRVLAQPGAYPFLAPGAVLASEPACLFATDLRRPEEPQIRVVEVDVRQAGSVGGVALWFRAELDDGLVVENAPGAPGHWGVQVVSWSESVAVSPGRFSLRAEPDGTGFDITAGGQ